MRLPTPSTSATTAATVTAPGRSPGASGWSLARASALRCSEREGGFSLTAKAEVVAGGVFAAVGRRLRLRRPNARLRADQRLAQRSRGRAGVVGLGARPHDARPPRSRRGARADRL